jgi:hypothetical protein
MGHTALDGRAHEAQLVAGVFVYRNMADPTDPGLGRVALHVTLHPQADHRASIDVMPQGGAEAPRPYR